MDIDYEKTFGFRPEDIGHRYRHHWVVVQPDSDEQRHGVAAGYLCVKARDGGYNPIDPDACRHPNFVASEDDPPDGMRFYYYRPLTDADREDPAATITALRKRVEELEGALEPFKVMADYHDDIDNGFGINRPDDMAVKVHLGHLRRARAALRAKGGEHGE